MVVYYEYDAWGRHCVSAIILFAKDPFIKYLERGMTEHQKEMFQREIEDFKYGEGRGGADNLLKKMLEDIAKMIKELYK